MTSKRSIKVAGTAIPKHTFPKKGGTHQKNVPVSAIIKLSKTGLSPRRIAKKLGDSIEHVTDVLRDAGRL